VTVLLAIATAALACFTYKMAKSTERALEQNARLVEETHDLVESNKVLVESEERHHQENLRPLCILEPTEPVMGDYVKKIFGDLEQNEDGSMGYMLPLRAILSNKGLGPALNVKVVLMKMPEKVVFVTDVPPIAAKTDWFITSRFGYIVPLLLKLRANQAEVKAMLKAGTWVIFVEFEDIFGKKFYSLHEKNDDHFFLRVAEGNIPSVNELFYCDTSLIRDNLSASAQNVNISEV
jgi:hypothetical protein